MKKSILIFVIAFGLLYLIIPKYYWQSVPYFTIPGAIAMSFIVMIMVDEIRKR